MMALAMYRVEHAFLDEKTICEYGLFHFSFGIGFAGLEKVWIGSPLVLLEWSAKDRTLCADYYRFLNPGHGLVVTKHVRRLS